MLMQTRAIMMHLEHLLAYPHNYTHPSTDGWTHARTHA